MTTESTKFFYDITPERVLAAVEHFDVRCTGRCLSLQSMENRVYDVEIETSSEPSSEPSRPSDRFRVIKFYRPGRWSEAQILEEHEFLRDLVQNEVPVVAPLVDKNGKSLLCDGESGIWYALFPKQGGRSPQELSDQDLPKVGRLLARLHTVGASKPAQHRIKLTPRTYGLDNLAFLLNSGALPPDYRAHYQQVVESICSIITPWFDGIPYSRVHGDAHLGNLLLGNEGLFWVDFDDMLMAPCVQDLWLLVLDRDEEAKRRMELLLSGYEELRHFDRSTLSLIEGLRALRMIHYTAWVARRFEDPAFKRTFPHFGTPSYWREQLGDMHEQLEVIQGAA